MTTESSEPQAIAADLEQTLAARMGLKRGTFPDRMKRAGRRLPRHVHRDGKVIEDALALQGNPRLARQVDVGNLSAARKRIETHLNGIDRADQRKGFILGVLGGLSFNLILAVGLFILFLKWRGML